MPFPQAVMVQVLFTSSAVVLHLCLLQLYITAPQTSVGQETDRREIGCAGCQQTVEPLDLDKLSSLGSEEWKQSGQGREQKEYMHSLFNHFRMKIFFLTSR